MIESWRMGPFIPVEREILADLPNVHFTCPVSGIDVAWAAKDAFNPGAVVHEGRVHMLFRGEDTVGRFAGTSRIGLAVSDDGLTFEVHPHPVLFPDDDPWQAWEWPGRLRGPSGGRVSRRWLRRYLHGLRRQGGHALRGDIGGPLQLDQARPRLCFDTVRQRSSKSGSIVTEVSGGRLVAARAHGRFWMYWGEGTCFAATSDDLVRWTPIDFDATATTTSPTIRRPTGPGTCTRYRDSACSADSVPTTATVRLTLGRTRATGPIHRGRDHLDLQRCQPPHRRRSLPAAALLPARSVVVRPRRPASCIARDIEPFLRADNVGARRRPGRERVLRPVAGAVRGPVVSLFRHGRLAHRMRGRARHRRLTDAGWTPLAATDRVVAIDASQCASVLLRSDCQIPLASDL